MTQLYLLTHDWPWGWITVGIIAVIIVGEELMRRD